MTTTTKGEADMGQATDRQAMREGVRAATFMGDPRVNRKQMEAIAAACGADPEARVLGLDRNMRPVVRARTGIPNSVRTWSLTRQGDPVDPNGLRERWRAIAQRRNPA